MDDKILQLLIEALSPIERKVLPVLKKESISLDKIVSLSETDKTTALRALEFLKNKEFVRIDVQEEKVVDLDINRGLSVNKYEVFGEVPERSNGHVWRTCEPQGSQGSNPCLSASRERASLQEDDGRCLPSKKRGGALLK